LRNVSEDPGGIEAKERRITTVIYVHGGSEAGMRLAGRSQRWNRTIENSLDLATLEMTHIYVDAIYVYA